jgi:glycosyltransferase involved in cell wall biosynthesis
MAALAAARGVAFTPHLRIPDAEVISLLNRASAMVYAPRLEPFGLAPIEAAACGLPVVAVAEGGVRETVLDDETGLLVANAPEAVAAAVARLLADPALARRLGAAGRANAERRWSLEAATDRIEQALLRSVAK